MGFRFLGVWCSVTRALTFKVPVFSGLWGLESRVYAVSCSVYLNLGGL